MTILQKAYNELLVLSNKRVSDLNTLHNFMQAAHAEISWLDKKEDTEVARDWADRDIDLRKVGKMSRIHNVKHNQLNSFMFTLL